MNIVHLFEEGCKQGLFTDFDVCVEGKSALRFRGGEYISQGAKLFDVASLTKACTHLIFLKLFSAGVLSPDDSFSRYLPVPQLPGDDRTLRHFLSYVVQSYNFDYDALRDVPGKSVREELLKGFGPWSRTHKYDNTASIYLGLLLEKLFGERLQTIFWEELLEKQHSTRRFLFHPVYGGLAKASEVVPTGLGDSLRGRVHDPLARAHERTPISVAGLFTDAEVLTEIFHRNVDNLKEEVLQKAASDQLVKLGIEGKAPFGLGFDIPLPGRFPGLSVVDPLIFTGYTGGRIFFAREPRVTVTILTNFSIYRDREGVQLAKFKQFCWQVLGEAIKAQL